MEFRATHPRVIDCQGVYKDSRQTKELQLHLHLDPAQLVSHR